MKLEFKRIPLIFIIDTDSGVGFWQDQVAAGIDGKIQQSILLGLSQTGLFPALKGLANIKNKLVIPMLVNPQSFSITKNPTVTKTLTKKGLLVQTWQSTPDVVNISGRAATQKSFFILSQLDALSKTMENGTRNIITMVYKYGGAYRGYIENFKTAVDAEQPGIFDYSFDFQFTDTNHFRLFLMSFKVSSMVQAINQPGKFFKEQARITSKELLNVSTVSLKNLRK